MDLNKVHYTKCTIQWLDDKEYVDVVIKSNDEFLEEEDDTIFYYGLSYDSLVDICRSKQNVDNEFIIEKIMEVWN